MFALDRLGESLVSTIQISGSFGQWIRRHSLRLRRFMKFTYELRTKLLHDDCRLFVPFRSLLGEPLCPPT